MSPGNVFRMSGSVLLETEEEADLRRLDLEVRGVIDGCARMETKLRQTIEHVNRKVRFISEHIPGVQQLYLEHWRPIVFSGGNVA